MRPPHERKRPAAANQGRFPIYQPIIEFRDRATGARSGEMVLAAWREQYGEDVGP